MGESCRVRAQERRGSVQARAASVAALGADGVVADKAEAYCPRSEGLARREADCATCPDTNELLSKIPLHLLPIVGDFS